MVKVKQFKTVVDKKELLDRMSECYSLITKEDFNNKETAIFIWGAVFGMKEETIEVEIEEENADV